MTTLKQIDLSRLAGSLPLVIGITGHRDLRLEDDEPLKGEVRAIFRQLRQSFPHTPLVLLSPLADGADRLAAWVALAEGLVLIVPLPMPRADYEQDFVTASSLAEFDDLLTRAETWFELPPPESHARTEATDPQARRDACYANCGAFIVQHSHLLLALWDGNTDDLVGGTSQTIRFQLEGIPQSIGPHANALEIPETGPVYHLVTPRHKNPTTASPPFTLHKLYPGVSHLHGVAALAPPVLPSGAVRKHRVATGAEVGNRAIAFERIFRQMDTFNRDALSFAPKLPSEREAAKEDLFGRDDLVARSRTLDAIADGYAVANLMSIAFRKRTVLAARAIFLGAWIAVFAFDFYAHLSAKQPGFLLLYLLALLAAFAVNDRVRRGDYMNKYLDYRALAEVLRIQFFWRLADIEASVADRYLGKQRSELDWIRSAIRFTMLLADAPQTESALASSPPRDRLDAVVSRWVQEQREYFHRAIQRDQRQLARMKLRIRLLFTLALLIAAAVFVLQIAPTLLRVPDLIGGALDSFIFLAGLLPATAAVLEGYVNKRGYAEHVKQYERLHDLFARAAASLTTALEHDRLGEVKRIIHDLGVEALAENGDWVLLHRSRPLDVPRG